MAVNCCVFPAGILGLAGVTDMEDKAAAVTVNVAVPEILPEVAVMVELPTEIAVTRPLLSTVATVVLDELQVTCMVIPLVVPSEYVPEAVNCWVFPAGILELVGVTDMEDKVAGVTVRVVFPEILPEVAVMLALPAATAVPNPLLSTIATAVLDDLQVTCAVISPVVPSEYVPEAANCLVFPAGRFGLAGVSDMEDRVAGVTVREVFPEILPDVAAIVAFPVATPATSPPLLTVATAVLDVPQVTCAVMS